ncbi:MAG: PilZ domain-containing protein [Polyangiaceae bacterium]|nr:PilZ domain-containing protein [Polyangiaceae bacterium]
MGKDERRAAQNGKSSVVERRTFDRYDVEWSVDCIAQDDTFLFASITNISQMGIFVSTIHPPPVGTRMRLSFEPPGIDPFSLDGAVAWINRVRLNGDNPNPGMGVRFVDLRPNERERLVNVIRTIAYVRDPSD